MTFLLNLPPRFRDDVRQRLWRIDPEADLVVDAGDPSTNWAKSLKHVGRSILFRISGARGALGITEPIYYCLTASPVIQACALRLDSRTHCVAVWMGAVLNSQTALYRLLMTSPLAEFYSFEPRPELAIGHLDGMNSYDAFRQLAEPRHAKIQTNKERLLVSALNTYFLDFFVSHELGHVVNGHTRLLAGATIDEADDTVPAEEVLLRQTLEMDADSFAFNRIIRAALNAELPHERLYRFGGDEERLRFRFTLALTATYFACRLFQRGPLDASTLGARSHPPGSLRLVMMLPLAQRIWADEEVSKAHPFPEGVIEQVVQMVERAAANLTEVPEPKVDLFGGPADNAAGQAHYERLLSEWATLRPRLERLKLGNHVLTGLQPR